jgi:hypothetical protein
MKPGIADKPLWLFLAALVAAASMWLFADRVLIPYQVADAAVHDRPRGNLSDLYPRWLGARELLLQGRDPYSREVTAEIQAGYYGRALDPNRPEDPKDQQGFAYPLYVVFLLGPLVHLPFGKVQGAFFWFLLFWTAATVPLWLRFLRMQLPVWVQVSIVALLVGSFAVMQGLKLQQMSLLVAGLIAAGLALLVSGDPIPAGILLALATIKPQLVLLLLLWLAIWAIADLRQRARFAISFIVTMAVLVGTATLYMPHWISRFWSAILDYQAYTGATPVLHRLIRPVFARALELLALVAGARFCWQNRKASEKSDAFAIITSVVLALTVLEVPTFAPYNQILLLPAMILLVRDRRVILGSGIAGRLLWALSAALVAWQWFASAILAGVSFILPANLLFRAWAVPTWTLLFIPVATAAVMIVYTHRMPLAASIEGPTA